MRRTSGALIVSLLIAGLGSTALGTGAGASGETGHAQRAAKSKKPKPCRKLRPVPYVLCKPVVATWSGTATQQTPSGPVSSSFELKVERKGAKNNGTRVRLWSQPELKWYCGNEDTGLTTAELDLPHLSAVIDKTGGLFLDFGTVISEGVGKREASFSGDFKSRTRVRGEFEGTAEYSFCASGATLLTVSWSASPG